MYLTSETVQDHSVTIQQGDCFFLEGRWDSHHIFGWWLLLLLCGDCIGYLAARIIGISNVSDQQTVQQDHLLVAGCANPLVLVVHFLDRKQVWSMPLVTAVALWLLAMICTVSDWPTQATEEPLTQWHCNRVFTSWTESKCHSHLWWLLLLRCDLWLVTYYY